MISRPIFEHGQDIGGGSRHRGVLLASREPSCHVGNIFLKIQVHLTYGNPTVLFLRYGNSHLEVKVFCRFSRKLKIGNSPFFNKILWHFVQK